MVIWGYGSKSFEYVLVDLIYVLETTSKMVVSGRNNMKEEFKDMFVKCGMGMKIEGDEETELAKLSSEEKTVIRHVFSVGGNVKKATEKLDNDFLRLAATLERKACFSFSVSVDAINENNYQEVYAEHSLKDHRTLDHAILDLVDCIGRGGIQRGLYIGSNGFLITEVIQLRRKFGHRPHAGGVDDVSELESCEYVEIVKLTGDPDVPAGQVAFRAKVGEKYKLSPWCALKQAYGAVARYKGQGRLPGFQKSGWVDVELFILEGEYRKDGFAIEFLYSAPDYYYLKLFKQLRLPSSGVSH